MSSEAVLNIKEVSEYLKIPASTVYKLVQEGRIPAIKLGKHWRVMKKDIDRLFLQTPQMHPRQKIEDKGQDWSPDSEQVSRGNPEKGGKSP